MKKDFSSKVKLAWLKSMEVIGTSASNLASSAKHKAAEMNLETRRREILTDFSLRAYDLWQKGETLPEPLDALLRELTDIDEKLSVLRAQKYDAKVAKENEEPAETPESAAQEAEGLAEEPSAVESDASACEEPQSEEALAESEEPPIVETAPDNDEEPRAE